ncbi:hypothetical protein EVAR_34646_1 [Eumeta japonica]|uniref:Uncharacterized protein n=1 Tax=Eumeta variegata TaxID=151549 RepID=A0A4C1VG55_EUMVA|nr:hypothetical protein EVAR_34646_1 [Eumeta japonica]
MSIILRVAYSSTNGLGALNEEQTDRIERPKYNTPSYDPIVFSARCKRVALEEQILEMVRIVTRRKASGDARENWLVPDITWVNGIPGYRKVRSLWLTTYSDVNIPKDIPNPLYLIYTQLEKESLITRVFGKGEGRRVLTIYEAQGLTSKESVIVRITVKHKLQDNVLHAVVAITRYTVSCVYYTDEATPYIEKHTKQSVSAILVASASADFNNPDSHWISVEDFKCTRPLNRKWKWK